MTTHNPAPRPVPWVRPSPAQAQELEKKELREKALVLATNEALQTIALAMPLLSRRKLGIKYAEAYRQALKRMRHAGLLLPYEPGEVMRYVKSATPRQILALRSSGAQEAGAE